MQFHARAFFQRFFHADSQGQKLLSEFEPCASLKLNSKMVKKKKRFWCTSLCADSALL